MGRFSHGRPAGRRVVPTVGAGANAHRRAGRGAVLVLAAPNRRRLVVAVVAAERTNRRRRVRHRQRAVAEAVGGVVAAVVRTEGAVVIGAVAHLDAGRQAGRLAAVFGIAVGIDAALRTAELDADERDVDLRIGRALVRDQPASSAGGENYGWSVWEGSACIEDDCAKDGVVFPALEYPHSDGCSVTGGHVYRGGCMPGLAGTYFYGDYCGGWVRSFRWEGGEVTDARVWESLAVGAVSTFGQTASGEILIADYAAGAISAIVAEP